MTVREYRQQIAGEWVRRTFGPQALSPRERVKRLIEEATELAQAEGLQAYEIYQIADVVFRRPVGSPEQEVGGVSLTLLAYCYAKDFSADELEDLELQRVLSKSADHFRRRQNEKAALGISEPGLKPTDEAEDPLGR